MKPLHALIPTVFALIAGLHAAPALAQAATNIPPPVALGDEDRKAFPDAPPGFDQPRDVPHGALRVFEYDSKTVGVRRRARVWTPPGYSADKKYPVLYLLHGLGGNEEEWPSAGAAGTILDNLAADGRLVPMIVVMPNGRAQKNDQPTGNLFDHVPAFAVFEQDLVQDLIPAVEKSFSVDARRERRAVAGLSMGGGQSLNFGLGHPALFGWVGGFSSAPNTREPEQLLPADFGHYPAPVISVSCGDKDGLIGVSQRVHRTLRDRHIAHIWHVDSGPHDFPVWRNDLYLFGQRLFR